MLAVDAAAIHYVSRRRQLSAWWFVMCCAALVALITGIVLAERSWHPFGIIRLWSYGLLLHGGVLLAATAILWRRHRPWLAAMAASGTLLIVLVAIEAFLIEPTWLEVSQHRIKSNKLHQPVRLAIVADLQTDHIGDYERRVFAEVMRAKPDVILLAGDYIQIDSVERHATLRRQLNDLLQEIGFSAPRGIYAVKGNVDSPYWYTAFANLGVHITSSSKSFSLDDLRITCLGLGDSFDPTLKLPAGDPQQFHLVLGHSPSFALGKIQADLLVAGHTHGGQIQLPFLGPIVTNCSLSRQFAVGVNELPSGAKLLVSRGIGMERGHAPRLRFLCRPELVIVDLVPETVPLARKE